jgi:shikimate dehydrogenase
MKHKYVLAGVMGWPVAHSRSPLIHNHWIQTYKLNGAYGLFPVQPSNLETAVHGLSALGIAGCNITIPHKVDAIKYVDWLSPQARKIGAINTIVVQPNGDLHGFNHDGFGFTESLLEVHPNWHADTGPAAVLGAGGACRSILVALLEQGIKEIRLLNRTYEKAQELAKEFGPNISALPWHQRHAALNGCSLLVNTTNQGMAGQAPLSIDLDELPRDAVVSDIVYTPLETQLLVTAKARGNPTVNGLGMLIHQARPAFHAWFNVYPEVTPSLHIKLKASLQ